MRRLVRDTLHIDKMRCHHCVMTVRRLLKMLNGIEDAEVESGVAHITYDPELITPGDMALALARVGYTLREECFI